MDISKLPKSVRETATALFNLRPDWEAKATIDDDGVLVSIPNGREDALTLRIDCHLSEIIVGFADIHNHFDVDFEHYVEKAIEYVDEIMNEQIISVSWWKDQEWLGSFAARDGDPIEPPREMGITTCDIRVRSFKGTHDQNTFWVDIRRN